MNMDPLFVVRCWSRIRGHILQEALAASGEFLNVVGFVFTPKNAPISA